MWSKVFARILKAAKLPHFRVYDLRHKRVGAARLGRAPVTPRSPVSPRTAAARGEFLRRPSQAAASR